MMTAFILHHELAHALIEQFELPLVKSAEDSADELGFILMFLSSDTRSAQIVSFAASVQHRVLAINSPHHSSRDVHSPNIQRSYIIGCLAYGASPSTTSSILKQYINESNEQKCITSYRQANTYWFNALRPYLHKN